MLLGLADGLGSGFCPDLSGTRRIARFEDDAGGEGFARIGAGRWFPYGCDPAIGYSVDSMADGRRACGTRRGVPFIRAESRWRRPGIPIWLGKWGVDWPWMPGPGASASCWVRGQYLPFGALRRNFEYYGEDPVLASAIACGYIEECSRTESSLPSSTLPPTIRSTAVMLPIRWSTSARCANCIFRCSRMPCKSRCGSRDDQLQPVERDSFG